MNNKSWTRHQGLVLLARMLVLSAAPLPVVLSGCSARHAAGPYAPVTAAERNTARATALNAEATLILDQANMSRDPNAMRKAESMLREALEADLYFGPAHNNLGVIFLARDQLYEAASEFEWARKLMPGHPDPRVNLGITLEAAGRTEEAIETYRTALEVMPEDIAAMQGLARLQVRTGKVDQDTSRMLSEIAMRGETKQWREWAIGVRAGQAVDAGRRAAEP